MESSLNFDPDGQELLQKYIWKRVLGVCECTPKFIIGGSRKTVFSLL
jgi:hypothetical protein